MVQHMKFFNDNPTAIRIVFKKSLDPDDFVERGMSAWLTDIQRNDSMGCFELFFDFSDFETDNAKYFKRSYRNRATNAFDSTAIEAGFYTSKHSVYFGDLAWTDEHLDTMLAYEYFFIPPAIPYQRWAFNE